MCSSDSLMQISPASNLLSLQENFLPRQRTPGRLLSGGEEAAPYAQQCTPQVPQGKGATLFPSSLCCWQKASAPLAERPSTCAAAQLPNEGVLW